jgi:hypothetical protein
VLEGKPSEEVRQRIQTILDKLKRSAEKDPGSDPRSVWLSLSVLEELGTPAARQVLEELGKGPAKSQVTRGRGPPSDAWPSDKRTAERRIACHDTR